ncbi:27869_t:CDS:1, partial [Dentiscutata erythropus]
KNHWENFVFRIKNNLTSHKQIGNDPKYRDFKVQLAYFPTLTKKNQSATMEDAQDQYYDTMSLWGV